MLTSPSTILQDLKHKILLKGKKIGRLEDVLDGPEDEAHDVSDDDNGAEAEEEKRRMKVGGLGWGTAGSVQPPNTAVLLSWGPHMALPCRRTRRPWRRHCLTAWSTARLCPSTASRRLEAAHGPLRSPHSPRPRPGSSSGMQVRQRGQQHAGGWARGKEEGGFLGH